jgi:hypothetical protein
MNKPAGKPLSKFTYADLLQMERSDLGTQYTRPGTQSTQLGTQTSPELGTQSTRDTQAILGTQKPEIQPILKMPEAAVASKWRDEREQLNLKLAQPLLERLRRYAFDNRLTVKDAVVQALEMLLGTQPTQGSLDTQGRNLPSIDDDIEDDDQTIVQLYEKATGNTFNERDREVLNEYRHFGEKCLTLAILMGRNRYRKKINSFRFFEGNIREIAAWQLDKIERELPFQWAQFRRRQSCGAQG